MKPLLSLNRLMCFFYVLVCMPFSVHAMEQEGSRVRSDDSTVITLTCSDNNQICVLRAPWGSLFPSLPTTVPFDSQTILQIIPMILRVENESHQPDTFYTNTEPLVRWLIGKSGLDAVTFLNNFFSLRPAHSHPLTHLLAWNAARSAYAQRGIGEIETTLGALRATGADYSSLPLMYFYFQLCRGERVACEPIVLDNFPMSLVRNFVSHDPQWGLIRSENLAFQTLVLIERLAPDKQKNIFDRLICQDDPLLLLFAKTLVHGTKLPTVEQTAESRNALYKQFRECLQGGSATAARAMLDCYQLNPNHWFECANTPLQLAIMRGAPHLVRMLLYAGANSDATITRLGRKMTLVEFAESMMGSRQPNPSFARLESNAEVWYSTPDDETIAAQERIITILRSPRDNPLITTAGPDMPADGTSRSASQDLTCLSVQAMELSPRAAARRNAFAQGSLSPFPVPPPAPAGTAVSQTVLQEEADAVVSAPPNILQREEAISLSKKVCQEEPAAGASAPTDIAPQREPEVPLEQRVSIVEDCGWACGCGSLAPKQKKERKKPEK